MPSNYHNLFTFEYKTIQDGQTYYHNCIFIRSIEEIKEGTVAKVVIPTISMLVWLTEEDYTEILY